MTCLSVEPNKASPASSKLVRFWKILGPGLVTGASDDGPSGIATYSQAGAAYRRLAGGRCALSSCVR